MRLPNLFRPLFAAAIIVAGLVMASCAVPAAPDQGAPDQPPAAPVTQPPVTVVVVVTATSVQTSEVQPTAIATAKAVVVQPSVTPTSKSAVVEPTATSTGKPPTAQPTAPPTGQATTRPTATSTSKPPTLQPSPTQTRTPTRTSTPPPSATPAPHTRTLYSGPFVVLGSPVGADGDKAINVLKLLPAGCEIVDVKALDFHLPHEIQLPPVATGKHMNTPLTGHGWTVARTSTDPRDLGVNVHWWRDPANMIDLRVVYTVREPWSVDCNVPGLTQLEP